MNNILKRISSFIIDKIKSLNKKEIISIIVLFVVTLIALFFLIASCTRKTGQDDWGFTTNYSTKDSQTGPDESSSLTTTENVTTTTSNDEQFTTVVYKDDAEDPEINMHNNEENSGPSVDISKDTPINHPTGAIALGIDVSRYQGTIDWTRVAASGIEYAMIRVGYRTLVSGEICEDPYAGYNISSAINAGIQVGVYFFSTAVSASEAIEEARWVCDFISNYNITYPVAYNCEGYTDSENRQYGLTKSQRSSFAMSFLDTVKTAGYTPMFYASRNELENDSQWNTEALTKLYNIWVAQYPATPYPDTPTTSYTGIYHMWQYTSLGTVPGINANVDLNISYLNIKSDTTTSATTAGTTTAPTTTTTTSTTVESTTTSATDETTFKTQFTEVNDLVTAKDEVNLRTTPSVTDSEVFYTLTSSDVVTRTGVSDNGWSRVIYNGVTLYCITSYLNTV